MSLTTSVSKKSILDPDEVREMPNGKLEIVTVGDLVFGKATFQPGWRWSESVKPIAQTESCELSHYGYIVSGALHVRMDDGAELDLTAGDVVVISPGHDGWVTGDEACVMYDFGGQDADYAKPRG
jgi:ethanolamine utilization protein EutQ (cupin superfamily)